MLYPNDSTPLGKELRLKQQYFFVSATLGIVELIRILMDEEHIGQEEAFEISYKTFSYTNHTVLPEALEQWSVELVGQLLPRHLELIYLINHFWLLRVSRKYPDD